MIKRGGAALGSLLLIVLAVYAVVYGARRLTAVTTFDEHDNDRVVHVAAGTTFRVTLHSLYWEFAPVTTDRPIRAVGRPAAIPARCVPGEGCGTLTLRLRADHPGHTSVTAHRDTCGEVVRCRPDQTDFNLDVVVDG